MPKNVYVAEVAALVGVSPSLIRFADIVCSKGIPELVATVWSGNVSVSAAAVVAANYSHEEQAMLVSAGGKAIVQAAKAMRAKLRP